MLNYIKAELYRNFNRAYFWLFTLFLSVLPLIFNIFLRIESQDNFLVNAGLTAYIEGVMVALSVPVFFVPIFNDMVTSEEYKNLTLRNVVTFGMNRTKIVLSKFLASTILAVTSLVIILTTFLGSATILFGLGSNFPENIKVNTIKFLVAVVLWIAAMAVGTLLALMIKNNNIFAVVYVMVFAIFNQILRVLEFFGFKSSKYIYDLLITTQLDIVKQKNVTNNQLGTAALIGLIYIIVFLILSSVYFNRQEVK